MNPEHVETIIERHRGELGAVISILEDIQDRCHYLPGDALQAVAAGTGRDLVDIYGVATFYRAFSLKPRGRHLVAVCMGTACHVRGAAAIAEEFAHQLKIAPGETTPDGEFTLETVNCLGACALGPIVMVDGRYFSNVKRPEVRKIVAQTRAGFADDDGDGRQVPLEILCPHCGRSLMDQDRPIEGQPSIGLIGAFDGCQGRVNLSGLFGSPLFEAEHDLPDDTVVDLTCPHCARSLNGLPACVECGSPSVALAVAQGGMLYRCARAGCDGHGLNLDLALSVERAATARPVALADRPLAADNQTGIS